MYKKLGFSEEIQKPNDDSAFSSVSHTHPASLARSEARTCGRFIISGLCLKQCPGLDYVLWRSTFHTFSFLFIKLIFIYFFKHSF